MKKITEYGLQLLEKQKLRKAYNLREKTLKNYFRKAAQARVHIDEKLVELLERRLDNVVYRLGWARTRLEAAQFVSHGHILVNGKVVKVSSSQVKKEDTVEIKENKKNLYPFRDLPTKLEKYHLAPWLKWSSKDKTKAEVSGLPGPDSFIEPIILPLVLQFYSR